MTNSFEVTLANLLKARFPYLYIPTWEEERLVQTIISVVHNTQLINTPRKVVTWSVTSGIQPKKRSKDTRSPWDILECIESTKEPTLFILKDFHVYFGALGKQADDQIIRKIRDLPWILKIAEIQRMLFLFHLR